MNNTPIVATMIPYVYKWSKKRNIAPSKLLIPLSYSAILGGMITLIGTSTNLVLNGLLSANQQKVLEFSDFFYLGIILSITGILYNIFWGYKVLPSNTDISKQLKQKNKDYLIEVRIKENSVLIGKTVQKAKLRNLEDVFLVEILRDNDMITPIPPNFELQGNDILFFAGDTKGILKLVKKIKGLSFIYNEDKIHENNPWKISEAVVPFNSRLVDKTIKEIGFRHEYNSAIIGIHRNGEKIQGKIGNLKLMYGDLLLLLTGKEFYHKIEFTKDLYPVSEIDLSKERYSKRKKLFIPIALLITTLCILNIIPFLIALLLIFMSLITLRLLNSQSIKKDINLHLLMILAGAITIGKALIDTGAAETLSHSFTMLLSPFGTIGLLIGVFILTMILTSFITNVAAVSIAFPIVYSITQKINVDSTAFYVAIAFSASAAFISPIGYQTNLMVYGPGQYKFNDFFKIGFPFSIIYMTICILYIIYRYNII